MTIEEDRVHELILEHWQELADRRDYEHTDEYLREKEVKLARERTEALAKEQVDCANGRPSAATLAELTRLSEIALEAGHIFVLSDKYFPIPLSAAEFRAKNPSICIV
ncbi:MAG: hypothetical protein WAV40_03290 [Microgenomates group bacterium]